MSPLLLPDQLHFSAGSQTGRFSGLGRPNWDEHLTQFPGASFYFQGNRVLLAGAARARVAAQACNENASDTEEPPEPASSLRPEPTTRTAPQNPEALGVEGPPHAPWIPARHASRQVTARRLVPALLSAWRMKEATSTPIPTPWREQTGSPPASPWRPV